LQDAIYTYIDDDRIFHGKNPNHGISWPSLCFTAIAVQLMVCHKLRFSPRKFSKFHSRLTMKMNWDFCALVTARVIYGTLIAPESHLR
jgi:hypothetical protein